jgi:predicted kinase
MTDRDAPLLVVVTGPPASGKTTIARALARELELPLFAKDDVKEALFDSLGTGDRDWSRRLGRAAFDLLFVVASAELAAARGLVLEGNFVRGSSERRFGALPLHRLVQVHCSAPERTLLERFRTRRRHAGHLDETNVDEVAAAIRGGRHRPLALAGDLVELDTSGGSGDAVERVRAVVRTASGRGGA